VQDECLIKAGGKDDGTMDFWQFHAYPWDGAWISGAPWTGLTVDQYEFDAPLVIGEFPTAKYMEIHNGATLPGGDSTEDLVTSSSKLKASPRSLLKVTPTVWREPRKAFLIC